MPSARGCGQLVLLGAVMGVGGAVALPQATAMTVLAGKEAGMGAVMGLFKSAMRAGMVMAPLISGVVMDAAGIENVFYVAAGISLAGTIVFIWFCREWLTGRTD